MCAGHVAAAETAAAAVAGSFDQPNRADTLDENTLGTALHLVANILPDAVQPALLAPLETLLKRGCQVREVGEGGCFHSFRLRV